VQQPCSNLGKYPENSGKALALKYVYLQGFCKLWKPSAKRCASLTRRGSLVQIQHRPLRKSDALRYKREDPTERGFSLPSSSSSVSYSMGEGLNIAIARRLAPAAYAAASFEQLPTYPDTRFPRRFRLPNPISGIRGPAVRRWSLRRQRRPPA
jgi:hypothetical protein